MLSDDLPESLHQQVNFGVLLLAVGDGVVKVGSLDSRVLLFVGQVEYYVDIATESIVVNHGVVISETVVGLKHVKKLFIQRNLHRLVNN